MGLNFSKSYKARCGVACKILHCLTVVLLGMRLCSIFLIFQEKNFSWVLIMPFVGSCFKGCFLWWRNYNKSLCPKKMDREENHVQHPLLHTINFLSLLGHTCLINNIHDFPAFRGIPRPLGILSPPTPLGYLQLQRSCVDQHFMGGDTP